MLKTSSFEYYVMTTGWLQVQLIWEEDHYHHPIRTDIIVSLFLILISLPLTFIVMFTVQGQQVQFWMDLGHQTCRDNPAQLSYFFHTLGTIGPFIILCPMILPPRAHITQGRRNRDYMFDANPHIERIARTTSVSILHELFHVAYSGDSK